MQWQAQQRPLIILGCTTALSSLTEIDYFGGAENSVLFIWSSVIPAIAGGLLYGWWIYGRGGAGEHAY